MINKKIKLYILFSAVCISSCSRQLLTNKETSAVGSVYAECLDQNAWDTLFNRYSVNDINDTLFSEALIEMNNLYGGGIILYLQSDPVELIAISTGIYSVRYIYNPKLSSEILNGFTLIDSEKKRILNRVQRLLMEFQCEEGKEQSLKKIKSREEIK
jgi:hypothetical protein